MTQAEPKAIAVAIDQLRELATAATPGPWIRSGCRRKMGDQDCIMVGPDGYLIAALPIGQPRDHAGAFRDAAFIAAANPQAILSLITAYESQAKRLREVEGALEKERRRVDVRDDKICAMRAAYNQLLVDTDPSFKGEAALTQSPPATENGE